MNPFGPMNVLNGSSIASASNGLRLDSDGNRVHALAIQHFTGSGILVTGNENELMSNYIGGNATGDGAAGNGGNGVHIIDSSGDLIDGTTGGDSNVISGNTGGGEIEDSSANIIQNNYNRGAGRVMRIDDGCLREPFEPYSRDPRCDETTRSRLLGTLSVLLAP